uniref:Centrosomal protein of 162 kDa n=1 Tax=Steinernema glaseri TaxID=37863 RepID=A0A1I7Z6L6_9BILA
MQLSVKLDNELEDTSKQASVLEERWFELQDELSDAQNALAFEQAKIKEQNVKKHRIQVAQALGRLEPKPTMYKRYLSAQSIDKKSSAGRSDHSMKRKDVQLKENLNELNKLNEEVESLKHQIEEARKARGRPPSTPSSGASSTRSRLSLPKIHLNEADKKTKKMIDEHTKEALRELKKEKQKLEANIALISTQVHNIEREIHKLHRDIKQEATNQEDLEQQTRKVEAELKDDDDRISHQSDQRREETAAKIQQRLNEIEELLTERESLDREKSKLTEEIEQAKVDENNLRNKYKTMTAAKSNAREDAKEYYEVKQRHSELLEREKEARNALETILRLQKAANLQNQIAKNSLSTVRPYFDEYTEYESLVRERRLLAEELKRSKSEGNLNKDRLEELD